MIGNPNSTLSETHSLLGANLIGSQSWIGVTINSPTIAPNPRLHKFYRYARMCVCIGASGLIWNRRGIPADSGRDTSGRHHSKHSSASNVIQRCWWIFEVSSFKIKDNDENVWVLDKVFLPLTISLYTMRTLSVLVLLGLISAVLTLVIMKTHGKSNRI